MSLPPEVIKNETLKVGQQIYDNHEKETKFLFHFKTTALLKQPNNENSYFKDDSRTYSNGKPVETIYGRKFKLDIWEKILSQMNKGEIRKLVIDDSKSHEILINYVSTVKCFRKHFKMAADNVIDKTDNCHGHGIHESSMNHSCSLAMQRQQEYKDLNELMKNPPNFFEFELELIEAINPNDYPKDIWQMNQDEKRISIKQLHGSGNKKFSVGDYQGAYQEYVKALSAIESLMYNERPKDLEWLELDAMKIPLLLNICQVNLLTKEYYESIKYANQVLERDPNNLKALFRRAKANSEVWNFEDAINDFDRCLELNQDVMLETILVSSIRNLRIKIKHKNEEDKEKYQKMFKM